MESQQSCLAAGTCLCVEPNQKEYDTKTQVNTGSMILNFEQSMSTLSLCSNTEAINAQCSYCPLDMGVVELVPFPS